MKTVVTIVFCFLLLANFGMVSVKPGEEKIKFQKISLIFHHTIGGDTLVLGDSCKNIFGENMVIEKFKYYISNFSVEDRNGKITKLAPQYFLIDEADPLTKIISLTVPSTSFKSIRFWLGVDSIKNVSGPQTGALDPLNGMFWTWNSGYIMAKLEGSSEASVAQGHHFIYHIGGFKNEQNAARMINLPIVQNEKPFTEIHITAEINQWFNSKSVLKIAETPVCQSTGILAVRIANNYSTMFSINSIH